MNKNLILKTALALAVASPLMASAESDLTIGSGTASADLDFRVIIPRVLYLAVGTGNATLADNATEDLVAFDFSGNPEAVGTGAAANTITGNAVPVRVFGNNGQIQIAASNGNLTDGGGNTIPLSQITATSSDAANFDVPAPGGTANPVLSAGRVTNRTATWTYSYTNSAAAGAGTYDGTITYTASMP